MKNRSVAHRLKYKSLSPPLEIIKDCHIHEDKWYTVMLSEVRAWDGSASVFFSAASRLPCSPCLGFYKPLCLILAPVRRVGASVVNMVELSSSVAYTPS